MNLDLSQAHGPWTNTVWMEFSVIPGRIQMEWLTLVEFFWKKGNTFRGIPFLAFVHTLLEWFALPATILLNYSEEKHCQWKLNARFTDEMWMLQLAKRATENSIPMISALPMWAFSSLLTKVTKRIMETFQTFHCYLVKFSGDALKNGDERYFLTLKPSFPCFHRPNLDEELDKSDLTWP